MGSTQLASRARRVASASSGSPSFLEPLRPRDHFYRLAFAHAYSHAHGAGRPDVDVIEQLYPGDEPTQILLRAATAPATLTTSGWASDLATTALSDAIVGLAPISAAAALFDYGLHVDFPRGVGMVAIPGQNMVAADAGKFVAEGSPIPVRQYNVEGTALGLRKLASIVVYSRELAIHSQFEPIVRQMVGQALGLSLDAYLFSTNADDGIQPFGLLNGATSVTAQSGGGQQALSKDVAALVGALNAGGGGIHPVIVAAPQQAASLKVWAGPKFDYPILASAALAAGTIVAIEASAFVVGMDPVPNFSISDSGTLHFEDTSPAQIGVAGSPNVVAAPARSLWQTDGMAQRTIVRINWGLRALGSVAKVTSVTW
jgi:hypothetical protein